MSMGTADEEKDEQKEREMSPEATDRNQTCPNCGAEIEAGAKFCTSCAAPLTKEAGKEAKKSKKQRKKRARKEPKGVEPWAVKAGDAVSGAVSRLPRLVKIWVPLGIVIIIAIETYICILGQPGICKETIVKKIHG